MEFPILSWTNCTVEEWQDVQEVIGSKGITPTDFILEIGDIFFDLDDDLTERDLNKLKNAISFVAKPIQAKAMNQVKGKELKNMKRLSLSNYVDLDVLLTNNNIVEALPEAVKILYDLNHVHEVCVSDVYNSVIDFMEYRKQVGQKYPTIFDDEEDEYPEDFVPEDDEPEEQPKSMQEQWLTVVFGMCQGDLTKYQHIMSLPHILVFNWVALAESLKPRQPLKTASYR